jgi:DNA-binding CsgD family transcriptional regulator
VNSVNLSPIVLPIQVGKGRARLRASHWKTSELRSLLRLSNSLHAVTDPVSRKRRLLAGLCELVSGAGGLLLVTRADRVSGKHAVVSATELGLTATSPEESRAETSNTSPRLASPILASGSMEGDVRLDWEAASRVLPSGALPWPPLLLGRKPRRRKDDGSTICSALPLSGSGLIASLCLFRPSQDSGRFTERQHLLVDLFHAETRWVYHPDLLLASQDAQSLSPRERQTLEHLLAGHSEKQIASRLKLSPNTVHHYVKSLHRHFGVSSRSELLARWVGK